MNSNRIILLLVLLVVFGGLAAWWFARPDSAELASRSLAIGNEALRNEGEPLGQQSEPGYDTPLAAEESPDSLDPVETPKVQPEATAESESAAGPEEPAHVPVYGVAVQRGGAYATFHLTDAKDQPLYDEQVKVTLWRRVGVYWIEDEAYWDADRRVILCDGKSAAGLEPGEYELEVGAGKYGKFLHRFRVNRGERLESTLRTENWRRIICVDFRLADGGPVEWIKSVPSVATTPDEFEFEARPATPGRVLREPPPDPRGGKGGFAYRRARGSGSRPFNFMYATDAGRFYVPVIAGAMNEVRFRLHEYWGRSDILFEDRFTGSEWDRYEVVLELVPEFDELTKDWSRHAQDNPGHRSHKDWVELELNPLAVDDPAVVRLRRLVIDLDAPEDVRVLYGYEKKKGAGYRLDRTMSRRGTLHYADAQQNETLWFAFRHNGETVTLPESVTFSEEIPGPVHKIKRALPMTTLPSPDWKFTPTLEAWAVHRQLGLVLGWENNKDKLRLWEFNHGKPSFKFPTSLSDTLTQDPPLTAQYWWRIDGTAVRKNARDWTGEWAHSLKSIMIQEADPAALKSALAGGGFAPPDPYGFVLRVIGPNNEGLPWVEGSIVPYEQDERARRLRDVERSLNADGVRPELDSVFGLSYYGAEEEFNEENIEAERMELFLGEKFLEQTKDKADLAYYARSGAWYNTRARVRTDDAGYVFTMHAPVNDSQKYVLYLWSNSRDDLQPVARIVFEATGELTDLGAITLPTYTK